jgi:hypothetical protein
MKRTWKKMLAAISKLQGNNYRQVIRRHFGVVNSWGMFCQNWNLRHPELHQQKRFLAVMDPDAPKKKVPKVKKKEKKSGKGDSEDQKMINRLSECLEAPVRKEGPISAEEKARRSIVGRNHVIGRFKQHNEIMHDISCKIQMKQHAVKMLPPGPLKEHALADNLEVPPDDRIIAGVEEYRNSTEE